MRAIASRSSSAASSAPSTSANADAPARWYRRAMASGSNSAPRSASARRMPPTMRKGLSPTRSTSAWKKWRAGPASRIACSSDASDHEALDLATCSRVRSIAACRYEVIEFASPGARANGIGAKASCSAAILPLVLGSEAAWGRDEVEGSAVEPPALKASTAATPLAIEEAHVVAEPAPAATSLLPIVLAAAAAVVLAFSLWRRWWRLPDDRGPAVLLRGDLSVVAFAGMILAGGIGAGLAMRGEPESLEQIASTMGGLVAGQMLAAAPFLWLIVRGGRDAGREEVGAAVSRHDRIAMPSGRAILIGLAAMAIAYPVIATVGQVASIVEASLRGVPPDPVAHDTLRALVEEGGLASAAGLCIAILVVTAIPWCEEFAYRGLLQPAIASGLAKVLPSTTSARSASSRGRLDGMTRGLAIAVVSIAFALMHVTALPESSRGAALATLVAVSIVLGWLFERTGRLAAPVAAHGLFNAINLALALAPA